jgi:hypothetical protein
MARPWIRWLSKFAIAPAVIVAALALPWVVSNSWFQQGWLSRQWTGWTLIAIAGDAAVVLLAAIWWLWWWLPRRSADVKHQRRSRREIYLASAGSCYRLNYTQNQSLRESSCKRQNKHGVTSSNLKS